MVSQWQVGPSHLSCHPRLADHSLLCPLRFDLTRPPPGGHCLLWYSGETEAPRTVPPRVAWRCAVQRVSHWPPDPPGLAAVGPKFNHRNEALRNAQAVRYYDDDKNTTNYGFMRLSCPSGILSYPVIDLCLLGSVDVISTPARGHFNKNTAGTFGALLACQLIYVYYIASSAHIY